MGLVTGDKKQATKQKTKTKQRQDKQKKNPRQRHIFSVFVVSTETNGLKSKHHLKGVLTLVLKSPPPP